MQQSLSPAKSFCLLFEEGEIDTHVFYIAERQGIGFVIVKRISMYLNPMVRFSRNGNAVVAFNSSKAFTYTHDNGDVKLFECNKSFGFDMPASSEVTMLISNDGKTLAISSVYLYLINLETKSLMWNLTDLLNPNLFSFSTDQKFIFLWHGNRIDKPEADYLVIGIDDHEIKERLDLPYREYKTGGGYTNNAAFSQSPLGSLIMHDLDKDTYFEFQMK
jgi:hypothetical protein